MDQMSCHGNLGAPRWSTATVVACFLSISVFLAGSTHGMTFNDPEQSYVLYNPPWSPSGEVQAITLQFRTVTGNALLFAHHYLRENETKYNFDVDHFAVVLQITSGRIKATHFFATITESITAGEGVDDDEWHTLSFSINPGTGVMSLTVDQYSDSTKLRAYQYAAAQNMLIDKFGTNPSAIVYLGGLPALDSSTLPRSYDRLMGCIDQVRFQGDAPGAATSAPLPISPTTPQPATGAGNPTAATTTGATTPTAAAAAAAQTTSATSGSPTAASSNATAASNTNAQSSETTAAGSTSGAGSNSTMTTGVEPTPTESASGTVVPISYRVMVEDGCVNQCETANPCQHGACLNQYSSMSCDCFMSGFEGPTCDKEGATPLTLGGFQYLTYTLYLGAQDTYSAQNLISMKFKINPTHHSAVLYYAVGALPIQTYLSVYIQESQLSVAIKYSTTDIIEFMNLGVVNDNAWHFVSVEQVDRLVKVTVDNSTMNQTLTGVNTAFTFDPLAKIGGGESMDGYPGLPVSTNFAGCMKEVSINHFDVVSSLQAESSTRISFIGGKPTFECLDIDVVPITFPTPESYVHLEGWLDADLSLSFEFRTANTSSLMLTGHVYMNETHQGRLTLDLLNGTLQVKLGTDPHVPLSLDYITTLGSRLHDGMWHTVNLTVTDSNVTVVLDKESTSFDFFEALRPRGAVYLGGWNGKGFEGCMQNIYMQGEMLNPTEVYGTLVMRGVTLDGCPLPGNPCVAGDVQCANGGTCIEEQGVAVCLCSDPKYTGSRCQFNPYKSSCAHYLYSGDTRSGAKLVDIDGSGPFQPFYINCDFSQGNTAFEISHNLESETVVRKVGVPHQAFELEYQFATSPMLAYLLTQSRSCYQHFDYHCFQAPMRLGAQSTFTSSTGTELEKTAMPFVGDCDRGLTKWMRDSGNITSIANLPITKLDFKPTSGGQFTKATLSLGPLRCEHTEGYTYAYTVSLLDRNQHLAMDSWRNGPFSFSFRTRDEKTVLFHQRATWRYPNFLMGSITGPNTLKLELHMNHNIMTREITVDRQLTDGQWHTITMEKSDYEIYVTVDFSQDSLTLPVGQTMGRFKGQLHIGGSGLLPSGFHGMSGCLSGVQLNGKYQFIYDYYNEFTNDMMQPGCSSACDKQPCQNGGQCLDEWGSYTCICNHPALLGRSCQIDQRLDTVTFKQNAAFVTFDPSDNSVLTGTFHFGFRTFQSDALLFYAYDQFGNFVQLDLEASDSVVMKFNDGKEVVQLVATMNITGMDSGSWVDVSVLRDGQSIQLVANGVQSILFDGNSTLLTEDDGSPFTGAETTVRPLLPFEGPAESFVKVYAGGVPEGTTLVPTLQGCLRGLVVNGEGWNLQEQANPDAGVSAKCADNCLPNNPCQHGGICSEMWDSFECNCTTTSYTGKTCTEDIGTTFGTGNALLYPLSYPADQPASFLENDDLHFGFSTTAASGTIFYVRNDFTDTTPQNYISVSLEDGHLKFVFNFGAEQVEVEKMGPYNDGYRHSVVVKRFGMRILIDVDQQGEDYATLLSAPEPFEGRSAIVVGGVEHDLSMFSAGGYEGCITSLYYNRITPLQVNINGLGMSRSECAAMKPSSATSATTPTDMPVNALQQKAMTMPPWDVEAATGEEVPPEENADKEPKRDILLLGIIIAAFAVAFFILIICIIVTVMSIKKGNSNQQQGSAAKDGEPKENDVLLEEGRGANSSRNHPSPNNRPSAEVY